jgi:hypothetical protein
MKAAPDTADSTGTAGRRQKLGLLFLSCWLGLCTVGLAALSLTHVIALPSPDEARVQQIHQSLSRLQQGKGPFAVHVLAQRCSCTTSLGRHLLGKSPDREELILFVGDDAQLAQQALQAGYRFQNITEQELTDIGLESAPVLALLENSDRLSYLGGYYDHPAASNPLDQQLKAALANGSFPDPLPIFGCATSPRLQNALNPLRLGSRSG